MLIENGIADGIDFFHMDALSSAALRRDESLCVPLGFVTSSSRSMASGPLPAPWDLRIGNTCEVPRRIFRDFSARRHRRCNDRFLDHHRPVSKARTNPHLLEASFLLRSEANPRSLARWPSSPAHLRMINARRSNPMGSSSHLTPNDVPGADSARSGDGADPDVRSERLRGESRLVLKQAH